ncbi:hypothetical protein [Roseibium sp. RKSG952]|nr:hypothetical protein [Roseibium sp. RKSG952]
MKHIRAIVLALAVIVAVLPATTSVASASVNWYNVFDGFGSSLGG